MTTLSTKYVLVVLILAFISASGFSQAPIELFGKGKKASGCYVRCLVPDTYQYWEETFAIYNGVYHDTLDYVRSIALLTDSLGRFQVNVVTDTTKTSDYTWRRYLYKELVKKGGPSELRKIVCGKDRTPKLFRKIQEKLQDLGLGYNLESSGIVTDEWKEVMKDYLESIGMNIPTVGFYDLEVLEALGIKTKKL